MFGYAEGMRADVRLRAAAIAVAPLAMAAGWFKALRVAQKKRATLVHAHWVIPGGVIGAAAARLAALDREPSRLRCLRRRTALPRDGKLHERPSRGRRRSPRAARICDRGPSRSAPMRTRSTVVPYGVDSDRFKPDSAARARGRARLGVAADTPLVFAIGRLVTKKGFEYLIEATAILKNEFPDLRVCIAGDGDLNDALRAQAHAAGVADYVKFLGVVPHHEVPDLLAAADVAVAPSIHDAAGNVDGLPNTVMEMLASATPLVTTRAGGIGAVATDGETARLVPERDAHALAVAIRDLLSQPRSSAPPSDRARETWSAATTAGIAWRETSRPSTSGQPDMWRQLLALVIVGYLPGAVLFRLPFGDRQKRAALPAEERAYWAVMLSVIVSTTIALLLAWMGVYTLERVMMCNVALAAMLAIGPRGNLRLGAPRRRSDGRRSSLLR